MSQSAREPVSLSREGTGTPELLPTTTELAPTPDLPGVAAAEATSLANRQTVPLGIGSTEAGAGRPAWPRPVSGQIGVCELLEEFRPGGMGRVFKARHGRLGHIVVLKTMRGEPGEDRGRSVRFFREAKAIASLRHPNVITLHDYGEDSGQRYFTMAFAPGGSLAQQRARYQAEPREAVALMEKVARAVHHAHEHGIFHRDLKPANILLDERGEPLLSDFGLAKFTGTQAELTRPGEVLGTTAYMSPEQARGRSDQAEAASDVWSLGVVLYELLVGRRPFLGNDNEEIRRAILRGDPPRPRSLKPRLPWALEVITLKCLELDPAKRYQSAAELADELARWLRGDPIRTQPEPWPRRAWRAIKRYGLIAAATATLGVAGGGLAVWYLSRPERSRELDARALRGGRAVTFIDHHGRAVRPNSFTWPLLPGVFVHSPDWGQQGLTLSSYEHSLLELVADPQVERFRIKASVAHLFGSPVAKAGIYFGHTRHEGRFQTWHAWSFNGAVNVQDSLPPNTNWKAVGILDRPVNRAGLQFMAYLPATRGITAGGLGYCCPVDGPGTAFQVGRWHTVTLDVGPDSVQASWDGSKLERVSREDILKQAGYAFPVRRDLAHLANYVPRGGVGLFFTQGTASFRDVTLESLPGS